MGAAHHGKSEDDDTRIDRLPLQAYLDAMKANHIQLLCPETEKK